MHQPFPPLHTNTTLLANRFSISPPAFYYNIKDITHLHSSLQATINKLPVHPNKRKGISGEHAKSLYSIQARTLQKCAGYLVRELNVSRRDANKDLKVWIVFYKFTGRLAEWKILVH